MSECLCKRGLDGNALHTITFFWLSGCGLHLPTGIRVCLIVRVNVSLSVLFAVSYRCELEPEFAGLSKIASADA